MKDISQLAGDISKREQAIKQLDKSFPAAMGVICVKEIKNNFITMQGVWTKRSPVTNKLYEYNRTADYRTPVRHLVSKYKNPYKGSVVHADRPLLVQTGNLRDSVIYKVAGKEVTIGVFHRTVNINGVAHDALTYAKLHNEGGTFAMFGRPGHKMPKRKFMPTPAEGPTKTMLVGIHNKYQLELNKIMGTWKA
jgi:hypothetical protein